MKRRSMPNSSGDFIQPGSFDQAEKWIQSHVRIDQKLFHALFNPDEPVPNPVITFIA